MKHARRDLVTIAAALCAACGFANAQSAHYPAGVEGIKGATLPPPGLYFRSYNYFYSAPRFPGGPEDFDLFAYVQAPRLIWITDNQIFGGYYGMDVLLTFPYQDVKVGPFGDTKFGVGDIFAEPITLSWHSERSHLAVGYGVWLPNGSFDPARLASPGKGFWTHMLTAGATWHLDAERKWALSALNRYEINHENEDTGITPGQVWTLEYGLSRTFNKTIDVGAAGYFILQTTEDSGSGASSARDRLFGIGPEINVAWPQLGLFASARYVYETTARNRPRGHTFNLTLTKAL